MDPTEIVESLYRAIERGAWKTVEALLTDDLTFDCGSGHPPFGKQAYLSMVKAMGAAFPDLDFHFRVVEVQGNVVKGVNCITGTHTHPLIPPVQYSFLVIPPTGKEIAFPLSPIQYTFRGDQIAGIAMCITPERVWSDILAQLGIEFTTLP